MTSTDSTGGGVADTAPAPTPGTRIRVVATDDPRLYVGATGLVDSVSRRAAIIVWDDRSLDDIALLLAVDRWEAVTNG